MFVLFWVVVGIIIVINIFVNFERALYLLLVFIPFGEVVIHMGTGIPLLNLNTAIIYPALITAVINRDIKNPPLFYPITIYIFVSLLSWLTVSLAPVNPGWNVHYAFVSLKRTFDGFFLYFIFVYSIRNKDQIHKCLTFIILGISLEAFWTFQEYLTTTHRRLTGTLGPNELGAFFSAYIFILIFYLLAHRKKNLRHNILLTASLYLSLLALFFSLSRGSLIAFSIGLLAFGFFKSKKLFVCLTVLITFTIFNYQHVLPQRVVDRIDFTFEAADEGEMLEVSATARIELTKIALQLFKEHPIFGVGYLNFAYYAYHRGIGKFVASHNEWSRVLSEFGLIGFIPFAFIFILAFKSGILLRKHAQTAFQKKFAEAFLACIISIIMVNLTGNRFVNGCITGYFWVLCALIYRSYLLCIQEDALPSPSIGQTQKSFASC